MERCEQNQMIPDRMQKEGFLGSSSRTVHIVLFGSKEKKYKLQTSGQVNMYYVAYGRKMNQNKFALGYILQGCIAHARQSAPSSPAYGEYM